MSLDSDYLMALEMQKRLMDEDDSDIEEVDFKKPSGLIEVSKKPLQFSRSKPQSNLDDEFLNRTQNLVHPQWETLDPTPDVFALFGQFDGKFFQGRLKCVTLEWSKRMYSCAGICYSRRNGFGMAITIRLSEPLLKLRPRKDLIETMLHEMIHAYCFVLNIREGNGGHGPNFKKIMMAINKVAGTNITVYHTFHDEVNLYKQHWWRCNGVCQDRGPFFGYVKRTSNRAPGPNDNWFAAHLRNCGGTFMKIKGPEKSEKKKKEKPTIKKGKENASQGIAVPGDLRKFFTPQPTSSNSTGSLSTVKDLGKTNNVFKGPVKTNGAGTMLINPKTKSSTKTNSNSKTSTNTSDIAKAFPPSSYPGLSSDPFNVDINSSTSGIRSRNTSRGGIVPPGGNLRNVVGLKDIEGQGGFDDGGGGGNSGRAFKNVTPSSSNWGRGSLLTSNSYGSSSTSINSSPEGKVDKKHLRDIWSKRFGGGISNSSNSEDKRSNNDKAAGDAKRRRISNEDPSSENFHGDVIFVSDENSKKQITNKWTNEDVVLKDCPEPVITLLSDDDEEEVPYDNDKYKAKINKNMTIDERQTMIKQEIMDESINLCDDDIELIDDEYDDNVNITTAAELADTSIIDEFFGDDTLMADFKRENDSKPSSSRSHGNPDNDIITCYICEGKMPRCEYAEHLNGCEGISKKIVPHRKTLKKLSAMSTETRPNRSSRTSARDILRNAGYTEDVLAQISSADETEEEEEFLNNSGIRSRGHRSVINSSLPDLNSSEDENTIAHRERNINKTTIECPACKKGVEQAEINDHLDVCLSSQ